MDSTMIYYSLAILVTILFIYKKLLITKKNRPPSPPSFPILGHLHLLKGKAPIHRTLETLAQRYGPVFSLRLGFQRAVVVSAPWAVQECLAKNDIVFANRPNSLAGQYSGYNNSVLLFASYGDHWRNVQRVVMLLALSGRKIAEAGPTRKEEVRCLITDLLHVNANSNEITMNRVNLTETFEKLVRNLLMRVLCGKRWEYEYILPSANFINICDFLPFLTWIGYNGEEKKMIDMVNTREVFLNGLLDEFREKRVNYPGDNCGSKSVLEELLDLQQKDPQQYTDKFIKGILLLLINAGTHTSSRTLKWAMSLLITHPETLKKARLEIEAHIGHDRLVDDSDLSKLTYLRSVINETLRLFPPLPLLVPHSSSQSCTIGNYYIEKGTTLFINVWAVHRDSKVWDEPNKFKPERFYNKEKIEFKFLPFGQGKRSCLGDHFALTNITLVLAALIQCFDWSMDDDIVLDVSEHEKGLVIPKEKPLEVMCNPRSCVSNVLSTFQ